MVTQVTHDDLDAATLDALRRGLPLEIDATGTWRFEGDAITHPRIIARFWEGLDVSDDGQTIVRLGEQWAYVRTHDCALRATDARPLPETASSGPPRGFELQLDDGRVCALDLATLWDEPDLGLRCTVPARASGRPLSVRLHNRARMVLAEHVYFSAQPQQPDQPGFMDDEPSAFLELATGPVKIPKRPPAQRSQDASLR